MVSYQVYTSIAYDVADDKGIEFEGIDDGARYVSELAELWRQDKQDIKPMTKQQVRDYLHVRVEP